jgi:hypothetical protein
MFIASKAHVNSMRMMNMVKMSRTAEDNYGHGQKD